VDLLIDGVQTFDSIVAGMEAAQHYILFQFYIIRDDDLGRRLCRVLADKARDGIAVFLLYDEIGSRKFSRTRLFRQLQMTGVQVAPFNTTQRWRKPFQLNFRNHRKNIVVDGKVAWIGGHNLGDEYLGRSKRIGAWRDPMLAFYARIGCRPQAYKKNPSQEKMLSGPRPPRFLTLPEYQLCVSIERDEFHGEWNYRLKPRNQGN
jgi:phosphatidylserine/phosphatidylglycerophosphate/cardiolipin synthase-like enzyme